MKKTLAHPTPYRYLEAPPEIIIQLKAFQACRTADPVAIAAFIRSVDRAAFESAQELWEARPRDVGRADPTVRASVLAFFAAIGLGIFAGPQMGESLTAWMFYWTFGCMGLAVLRMGLQEKCRDLWRAVYFARLDRPVSPPPMKKKTLVALPLTALTVGLPLNTPAQGEALDLDAPSPPDLHAVNPWTASSVRLAQDLAALAAYQAALQQFHAWLDSQLVRGHR